MTAEIFRTDREAWDVVNSFRSSSRVSIVAAAYITCWLVSLLPDLAAHRQLTVCCLVQMIFGNPVSGFWKKVEGFLNALPSQWCWPACRTNPEKFLRHAGSPEK